MCHPMRIVFARIPTSLSVAYVPYRFVCGLWSDEMAFLLYDTVRYGSVTVMSHVFFIVSNNHGVKRAVDNLFYDLSS